MSSTRSTLFYLCVVLALGAPAVPALGQSKPTDLADQPGLVLREFVYEAAPFPECHASSIVETDGTLVATWFGGTEEKHPDVGIWVSRLDDGKWTAPVEVANGVQQPGEDGRPVRFPTWNPVLFQPKAGPLLLFYKVGPLPSTWWGMLTTSTDGGQTWSPPRRLPEGVLGPIKNKPIELADGDLLCPSSTESTTKPSKWQIHFERTRDLGKTWEQTGPLNDGVEFGAIQPSILELGDGRLQAVGRTRQGSVFQIRSDDGGRTWGKMGSTSLPNPNSGIDAVTLRDGRHLIVYNHTRFGRSPLNVAISTDGADWKAALVLENEPGEYSYPAVIQAADGSVHITYTWRRKRIRHAVVDPGNVALSAPK
jgi:predicted neuraminidase